MSTSCSLLSSRPKPWSERFGKYRQTAATTVRSIEQLSRTKRFILLAYKARHHAYKQKGKDFEVVDTQTDEVAQAREYKPGKYRADFKGRRHYFTDKAIQSYRERIRIKNRRNNVEASLFQISFFTRSNKTRYRGRFKNQLWATCRAAWMNLKRITQYLGNLNPMPA